LTTATVVMWIFLGVGALICIFTIITYACEEGSCTLRDMCRGMILCCTCWCCDIGKSIRPNKNANIVGQQPISGPNPALQRAYSQDRQDWLGSSKRLLGFLGFAPRQPAGQLYNPAPQMQGNVMLPPQQPYGVSTNQVAIQQGYNNQRAYAPPPPPEVIQAQQGGVRTNQQAPQNQTFLGKVGATFSNLFK
jgi:hypothetical protein